MANTNSISTNNLSTINSNGQAKNNQNSKIPPSIPNYAKGININVTGTSVLNK